MKSWLSRMSVLAVVLPAGWAAGATPSAQLSQVPSLSGFEATPAGESTVMVDAPRFGTDSFSVGLSLNYAYKPLVLGVERSSGEFQTLRVLIEHQLLGQLDLTASLCNCGIFSLSLPITLMERGDSSEDRSPSTGSWSPWMASAAQSPTGKASIANLSPPRGVGAREPRLGMLLRLYGQPDTSPFSVSAGGYLWLPLRGMIEGAASRTSGEEFRVMPRLVLAGYSHPLQWSLTSSFLYRPEAHPGAHPVPGGDTAGSELGIGAHVGYTDTQRGFSLGPEALLTTVVIPGEHTFEPFYTSLEVLLGLQFKAGRGLQVGLAAGAGLMRQPGTPEFRFLVRVSSTSTRTPPSERREAPAVPPGETSGVPASVPVPAPLPTLLLATEPEEEAAELAPPQDERPSLVVVKDGTLLLQRPITFALGTDTVLGESFPLLRAVADALRASPWIQKIRIEGHTDNQGPIQLNNALSIRRAQSVMRWLQEDGIDPARMEAAGYGPSRPIAGNDTEQGRATNRRVDMVIIEPPSAARAGDERP